MRRPSGDERLALVFLGAVVLVSAGILGWIVISALTG
jgi:preprotein translocase subunit Sss1